MAAPVFSVIFTIIGSLLLLLPSPGSCQFGCQGVGFYPHPSDCSQFYRCTDIWSTGQYQQYVFTCAEGTVFDASISVCNWPQLVPGCGGPAPVVTDAPVPATEPAPEVTTSLTTPVKEDEDEVTYRPAPGSFYQCEMPGIADDEKNCNKFWLCKEQTEGSGVLEALLYRCPEGYLFSSSVLRCKKEEDVSCIDTPETRNVNVIQLTENNLEAFFNKWSQI